jgi:amino acid transporter
METVNTLSDVKEVFVRKASGLVRTFSARDVIVFNMMFASTGFIASYSLGTSAVAYPGGDLVIAMLIWMLPTIFVGIMYVLMSTAMPRSGGDYVWNSRILHPIIGFVANFGVVIYHLWSGGYWVLLLGTTALPPFLWGLGIQLNNPALFDLAYTLSDPLGGALFLGIICLIILTLIVVFLKPKNVMRIQAGMVILGFIAIALTVGILLATPNSAFISGFNDFAATFGFEGDYYAHTLAIGAADGMVGIPITAWAILGTAPGFAAYTWWFVSASSYMSGEIKKIKRSTTIGVIGSVIFQSLTAVIMTLAIYTSAGKDFVHSIFDLFYVQVAEYWIWPVYPYPEAFASILVSDVLLKSIIFIGFLCWSLSLTMPALMIASRCIFSWGFDRLMPSWLTDINPKHNLPLKAIAVSFVIALVGLIGFSIWPVFYASIWGSFVVTIMVLLVGISAVLFPYTKKQIYEASPISKYKYAGVPLLSICGIVTVLSAGITAGVILFDPMYTWASIENTYFQVLVSAVWITAIVIYLVARAYRKSKGMNIDLAYKEIPPE